MGACIAPTPTEASVHVLRLALRRAEDTSASLGVKADKRMAL